MSNVEVNENKEKAISVELKVIVHYPAATKPFKDDSISRTETVGEFKDRVLDTFGLNEGQSPEGNIATFTLHYKKMELANLSQSLGEIAGDKNTLEFKLAQQITQG